MTCKEHILSLLERGKSKWHSSLEIELVGRTARYLGGTATRAARELAEKGEIVVRHTLMPVTHNGKTKNTRVAFYKNKK